MISVFPIKLYNVFMPSGVYPFEKRRGLFRKGATAWKNRTSPKGEEHWKWSKNPSYIAIHQWVNKQLGRPRLCTKCGFSSENGRQFHWANISGKYLRDLSDWVRLCVSCHFKMDGHHKKIWKTRKRFHS